MSFSFISASSAVIQVFSLEVDEQEILALGYAFEDVLGYSGQGLLLNSYVRLKPLLLQSGQYFLGYLNFAVILLLAATYENSRR